jgi:hypothetical protein
MRLLIIFLLIAGSAHAQLFTREVAETLAKLPLECINKEFPNKTGHSSETATDHVLLPSELHPSFYGCFDWHSSVHGHWMLIKLLKVYPDLKNREEIIRVLEGSFQPSNILTEAQYFSRYSTTKTFERTYGWAWLLKLDEELMTWSDPLGKKWHTALQPLTSTIVHLWTDFLPKQTYPNRTGVHPNTAFGLAFALDWAAKSGNEAFGQAVAKKAMDFYGQQTLAPAYLEPDGSDFFSPALQTADLMRRVLMGEDFVAWFDGYLDERSLMNVLQQPVVSDRNDYQIVHLDGLSLSRAWCFKGIASALPSTHPYKARMEKTANEFLVQMLPQVVGSTYGGSHWLGSFAVYAIFN